MQLIDLRPKRVGADLRGVCQLGANVNQNEPEVDAYITGLTTPLSSAQIGRLNTLVASLKSGLGISALSDAFDTLYVLAGETSESSLRNLVKNAPYATAVNSPAFTQFEGFTGNGTSSYINTNFTDSTSAVRFKVNNASYFEYIRTNLISYGGGIGSGSSGNGYNTQLYVAASVSVYSALLNQGGTFSAPQTGNNNNPGLLIINKTSANSSELFKNLISLGSRTSTTNGYTGYASYINARNTSGTASNFSRLQISIAGHGRAFSSGEMTVIQNAFEAYMNANGTGVIS